MTSVAPSRRLATRSALDFALSIRSRPFQPQSVRYASDGSNNDGAPSRPNPFLDAYKKQNEGKTPTNAAAPAPPLQAQPGDISTSSIFEDDLRVQRQAERERGDVEEDVYATPPRDPQKMARIVDPDPKNRERYERKKIIQSIRKGGRLTPKQVIKRTEREHLLKSHMIKTSQKKLGMLARQIAGKPIEEAILQMRFSKKKAAIEVAKQLAAARDEAIVMRGMGLGSVTPNNATDAADPETTLTARRDEAKPISIELKNGKRHTVKDPHTIYIDQAWIGRGAYGKMPDYRARGRVFMMRTPWTSISVLLKEEKTRIREYEAREAKRKRRALVPKDMGGGLWTHLPDRPVQWQRPWYTF